MTNKYLPEQLKRHPDFIKYQDVISIVLDPKKFYSFEQANTQIQKFLNREVDNG